MDSLIPAHIVKHIRSHIENYETVGTNVGETPFSYNALFDGEDELKEEFEKMLSENIKAISPSKMRMGDGTETAILRLATQSLLLGFLSERYMRDKRMNGENKKQLFKKSYDSISTFLDKMHKDGREDITSTAKAAYEETDDKEDDVNF